MTETITIVYRDITPAEAVVLAEHPKARASAWSDLMHERDAAKAALAAAEARNATLTDDAARWQWLRDDGEGPTGTLCMARIDGDGDQILCEVSNYNEEADAAIQARAAGNLDAFLSGATKESTDHG